MSQDDEKNEFDRTLREETFRAQVKKYRFLLLGVIIGIIVFVFGYTFWNITKNSRGAAEFSALSKTLEGDTSSLDQIETPSSLAKLAQLKVALGEGDQEKSREILEQLRQETSSDASTKGLVLLQAAQQGDTDALNQLTAPNSTYAPLATLMRIDMDLGAGRKDEALASAIELAKTDAADSFRPLIEELILALGGAIPENEQPEEIPEDLLVPEEQTSTPTETAQ